MILNIIFSVVYMWRPTRIPVWTSWIVWLYMLHPWPTYWRTRHVILIPILFWDINKSDERRYYSTCFSTTSSSYKLQGLKTIQNKGNSFMLNMTYKMRTPYINSISYNSTRDKFVCTNRNTCSQRFWQK